MASKFDSIIDITPEKETWTILARVIRLWLVNDFAKQKLPFSMELLLVDQKGDKIHASIRRTLMYKWDKILSEGNVFSFHNFGVAAYGGSYKTCRHSYKLNIQFHTKIEKMDNSSIPPNMYDFVNIGEITRGLVDIDYLVDVIGLLTGVGTEREYERSGTRTKINVIAVENDGEKIECTLFGSYVDELNNFLATGEVQNAVVVVQLGKVKRFQEKIHLQNCFNQCTKIIFNPDCEEAVTLRARMNEIMESPTQGLTQLTDSHSVPLSEDFLEITPRKTIEALKECKEESAYVVLATVKHIVDDDDWWYTACVCNKAVYPDHKMFFCEKCNKHVMQVVPRYRIKIRVIDETDSATFVIFDRDAKLLFNKPCTDMFETNDKSAQGSFPKEIADLVDKTFLFKVEFKHATSSKFEQTFAVKKICTDPGVINKFNEIYMNTGDGNSENAYLGGGKQKLTEGPETLLAQNLISKFSSSMVDIESKCDDGEGCDLSKDSDEMTPLKRDYETSDLELPLKLLKKHIKVEKD